MLLASLFQRLPIGSLAFRTNLLSVMAMIGASLWIYLIVQQSVSGLNLLQKQLAGVTASLAFGTSEIAWSQAVITEVYALHTFFVGLILYLISDPTLTIQRDRKVFVIGLVLGMALGNHVTMVLLAPGIIALVVISSKKMADEHGIPSRRKFQLIWKDLIRLLVSAGITSSSYLLLPLWANTRPPVNWGNPVTLKNFLWLVSGKLYQDQLIGLPQWNIEERLQDWAHLLLQQFSVLGLILALVGLVIMFAPKRIHLMTLWAAVSVSVFAMSYRVVDWYIHLIPVYLVFGIWIGLGYAKVVEVFASRGRIIGNVIGFFCVIYFIGFAISTWKQVDASEDMRAEDFGREVMGLLPKHTIVFADGDRTIFTLWYFHFGLHNRPDIFVLATDLLPFDWYRETLRSNYPDLNIPALTQGIWQDSIMELNPAYPACYPYYSDRTVLNCR